MKALYDDGDDDMMMMMISSPLYSQFAKGTWVYGTFLQIQ